MNFKILLLLSLLFLVSPLAYADPNEDLISAVRRTDLEGVTKALDEGANVNSVEHGTTASYTPLIAAITVGPQETLPKRIEILKLLISKGADVNATGELYDTIITPLTQAIQHNQPAMVAVLLSQPNIIVDVSDLRKTSDSVARYEEMLKEAEIKLLKDLII